MCADLAKLEHSRSTFAFLVCGLLRLYHGDVTHVHVVLLIFTDGILTSTTFLHFICWSHIAAALLFTWASYHQYTCHVILANLRRRLQTKQQHGRKSGRIDANIQSMCEPGEPNASVGIPVGDWFHLVSCPHYLAEVLIYCSVLAMERCSVVMLLPCVFVICVLTLSARQMHSWYCYKFDDYPKNRKRIFPFLF